MRSYQVQQTGVCLKVWEGSSGEFGRAVPDQSRIIGSTQEIV